MFLRLWAILLCLALLPYTAFAVEEETVPFVPLTTSETVYTDEGVTVTGQRAVVDYSLLRQLNPDLTGWLYQESSGLNQPILQGTDNDFYQSHAFDRTRLNNKGSVTLDVSNAPSMTDGVVYLYGLGREGSCFESINGYAYHDWHLLHPSLRLLTPAGDWQADVFACINSTQKDNQSWRVPMGQPQFDNWLSGVLSANYLSPTPDQIPAFGDRILVIVVNNKATRRLVVYAKLRPIHYAASEKIDLLKQPMDLKETTNGWREIEGLGTYMVYAQNDPLFDRMRYESQRNSTYRVFGGGGCGPTAAAIAVANLVPMEQLPRLSQVSKNGIGTLMCPCSVNRVYCNHLHAPYLLQTPEEYFRYLPVAMADFAAGNNQWGVISRRAGATGSNMRFLDQVCELFGIRTTKVANLTEGLEALKGRAGECVMICTALRKSPFTNSSHYVVVAGVDEEYFYVLDPQRREDYVTTDTREILEKLDDGVCRIPLHYSGYSDLTPIYIMERPEN